MNMKVFIYDSTPYIRVIPVKRLFNSTMVHEVVNRGDFFAVNLLNSTLTILPAGADKLCSPESFLQSSLFSPQESLSINTPPQRKRTATKGQRKES